MPLDYPSFDIANEILWVEFEKRISLKENSKSFFDMLTDYSTQLGKLNKEIVWKKASSEKYLYQSEETEKLAVVVFGECG